MRSSESQKYPILARMSDISIPASREIKRIYVHHSLSPFGDSELIEDWHLKMGFNSIGYNFVVARCERKNDGFPDGVVQLGRDVDKIPAHVKGDNSHSIGICVIGLYDAMGYKNIQGEKWRWNIDRSLSLRILLATYCRKLSLTAKDILGHREAGSIDGVPDPKKSCPGYTLSLVALRRSIRVILNNDFLYNFYSNWYEDKIIQFQLKNMDYVFHKNS